MDIITVGLADIVKFEETDDGHLLVFGKATGPDLDLDKQICDPAWLATAMPAWFESGANVREQHSAIAAGVGKTLTVDGDDYFLDSLVVDEGSKAKVKAEVLKGYSVGIKGPKIVKDAAAPGGRIVGVTIVEVSLVDRPANPTCKVALAKAAGSESTVLVAEDAPVEAIWADEVKGALADPAGFLADRRKDADIDGDVDGVDLTVEAMQAIARLILGEAEEMVAGMGSEAPLRPLLEALSALRWFADCDAYDDREVTMDYTLLGVDADLVKAANADDASEETLTEFQDAVRKALGVPDSDELVTKAVDAAVTKFSEDLTKALTDATAPVTERLDTIASDIEATKAAATEGLDELGSRLAEVEQMAAPGGPIRARTHAESAKAAERDELMAKAAKYRALASEVDSETGVGYRAKAAELEGQAKAL